MLEVEQQRPPADFSKLHILCWAGLSRPGPQKSTVVDISKLLESRDSKSPGENRSTPSTARDTANATPGPPATLPREPEASVYQSSLRNNPLPPPQPSISTDSVRSPPHLPPVSSIQPGPPLLQPSPYHTAQPYAPHAPQYYSAPPPAHSVPAYPTQNLPSLAATLGPAQPPLLGPPSAGPSQTAQVSGIPTSNPLKRSAEEPSSRTAGPPEKRHHGKWTPEEDRITIELRRQGMKWEDISKHIPGRSAISCRLRYQNYCERRPDWDEEKKNKLARLYNRYKRDMWQMIATELVMPWRAVEAMGWQMGIEDMNARANERVFQTHPSTSKPRSPPPSTPGSSGGEASGSAQHQVSGSRHRRSSSSASNRRRAQSDAVSRNERTTQLSTLPVVSETMVNEGPTTATATALAPTAADELYATPSPPPSYRRPSMEGSSVGNPPTPQRDIDYRRSGSFTSSAAPARDQVVHSKTDDPSI